MIGWRRRAGREIVRTTRQLAAAGLVHGTTGNVSARRGARILITPTRCRYERLRPRHLVELSADGDRPRGGAAPSRELPLHRAIYARLPDVGAVVHAHGPASVAWGLRSARLPSHLEESAYYALGDVRTVPRAASGSSVLAATAAAALDHAGAVLLVAHGLVAVGASPAEALHRALAVEHICRVALMLDAAGAGATAGQSAASAPTTPRPPPGGPMRPRGKCLCTHAARAAFGQRLTRDAQRTSARASRCHRRRRSARCASRTHPR